MLHIAKKRKIKEIKIWPKHAFINWDRFQLRQRRYQVKEEEIRP